MKLSRKLLNKITFFCLALTTALLVIVVGTNSTAQIIRNPSGETFPEPSPDSPTFTIRDGSGRTSARLGGTWLVPVPINETRLDRPIAANPDVATVPYEEPRSIPVLTNDTGENLTVIEVTKGIDGAITSINSDGTVNYSFEGNRNTDRFSYTIRDRYGKTATATVFIELFLLNSRR